MSAMRALIIGTTSRLNRGNRVDVAESHCPIWRVHGNVRSRCGMHPDEESEAEDFADRLSLLVDKRARQGVRGADT